MDSTADALPPNHTSDLQQLEAVSSTSYIQHELSHGALLGPYKQPPFTPGAQVAHHDKHEEELY